jgi:hypothetical protein
MSEDVDLSKPIEVVDFFGVVSLAKYLHPLESCPEHHMVWFEGEEHTVDAKNPVVGHADEEGAFNKDYYQLRNRKV